MFSLLIKVIPPHVVILALEETGLRLGGAGLDEGGHEQLEQHLRSGEGSRRAHLKRKRTKSEGAEKCGKMFWEALFFLAAIGPNGRDSPFGPFDSKKCPVAK